MLAATIPERQIQPALHDSKLCSATFAAQILVHPHGGCRATWAFDLKGRNCCGDTFYHRPEGVAQRPDLHGRASQYVRMSKVAHTASGEVYPVSTMID